MCRLLLVCGSLRRTLHEDVALASQDPADVALALPPLLASVTGTMSPRDTGSSLISLPGKLRLIPGPCAQLQRRTHGRRPPQTRSEPHGQPWGNPHQTHTRRAHYAMAVTICAEKRDGGAFSSKASAG
jgi:hypothetical protein